MFYEIRMLRHEQAAGRAGYEQGMQRGIKRGRAERKVDSAKIILESQLNNGRTLEQVTEFVRDSKLISDKELERIVTMYK